MISRKNSPLSTISFCSSPGNVSCAELRAYQIRASLMKLHAEGVQHLCRTAETNHATPLFDRKRGEKNRHEPVLTPRQAVSWMASHLKKELSISALMQELTRSRSLYRQPAENEWTRSEPEILVRFLSLQTNAGNCF
jgi:hypothetical protein